MAKHFHESCSSLRAWAGWRLWSFDYCGNWSSQDGFANKEEDQVPHSQISGLREGKDNKAQDSKQSVQVDEEIPTIETIDDRARDQSCYSRAQCPNSSQPGNRKRRPRDGQSSPEHGNLCEDIPSISQGSANEKGDKSPSWYLLVCISCCQYPILPVRLITSCTRL